MENICGKENVFIFSKSKYAALFIAKLTIIKLETLAVAHMDPNLNMFELGHQKINT